MQTLYSVSVQARTPTSGSFDAIRHQVVSWAFPGGGVPDSLTTTAGEIALEDKRIAWDVITVAGDVSRMWSLDVCTPLVDSPDAEFVCAVVVGQTGNSVGLQVDLGRRASVARVAPAPLDFLNRPRVVPLVLNAVPCVYGPNEDVDAKPTHALVGDVGPVLTLLQDEARRLPVLMVSTTSRRSPEATLGTAAADRLAGLAHVVVLDTWLALDAFNARHALKLPLHGARLFWPSSAGAGRHPWWTADQLRNARVVSDQLFHMLARLSVVANARNHMAETIRQAERDVARLVAQSRIDEAVATGDLEQAVSVLGIQLEEERQQVLAALELNEQLEDENRQLRSYKENFDALVAYQPAEAESEPTTEELEVSPDFRELWPALEAETNGALVFTDHAKSSWIDAPYPFSDRMRDALQKLAQTAVSWRDKQSQLGMSLTSWFTLQVGLQYAADDEGMRRAKLDTFEYEGGIYQRLSHIKLDDNVSPERVGRIYFAIDKEHLRWIVDHVGVKIFSH